MFVACQRCGEPWNLAYVSSSFTGTERNDFQQGVGCPTCYQRTKAEEIAPFQLPQPLNVFDGILRCIQGSTGG